MTFTIPQAIFDKYNEVMDAFLANNNFSRICTIHYPPIKETCTHCTNLAGGSINTNQWGGPAPYSFDGCNYCGGIGYREKDVTDTIRLRIYWHSKDWIKIGNIAVPNAMCQVIGSIDDLPKMLSMAYISLISEENGKTIDADYKIVAKPFFHGFGKNRYFIVYLEDA